MTCWPLRPHPATPGTAVHRLDVSLADAPDGWRLSYRLVGALHALLERPAPRDTARPV